MTAALEAIPEPHRDKVRAALGEAFPAADVDAIEPGPSSASGATTYRILRRGGDHLLRVEGSSLPDRNPHQYTNLVAAAEAGIAPPVRLADDASGVVVMQWVDAVPLTAHPHGAEGLAAGVGTLIARLQALARFPDEGDWAERVGRLLAHVRTTVFAPGLLDEVVSAYERIQASWPRDAATFVAAHNDPNLSNLLYDGTRLWLVDWETSSPNDPLIDLAVAANQLAPTDELRTVLLSAWAGGREPTPVQRARLALGQYAAKLFAGCAIALITSGSDGTTIDDLDAPPAAELERRVVAGELAMGAPDTMVTFAKVLLASLRHEAADPRFDEGLRVSASA